MGGTIKRVRPRSGTVAAAVPSRALLSSEPAPSRPAAAILSTPQPTMRDRLARLSWTLDDLLVGVGALAAFGLLAGLGSFAGHTAAKATKRAAIASVPPTTIAHHTRVNAPLGESEGPCAAFAPGQCPEPLRSNELTRQSQYYLHLGDAEVAMGRRDQARSFYSRAVVIGQPADARSAALAVSRLQFLDLACSSNADAPKSPVSQNQQQRALKALGYYQGRMGTTPGAALADAIRAFQSDLWLDETGDLDHAQSILLLCGAADLAQDASIQRELGLIYAAGSGVAQNTSRALDLLDEASLRGDASASWNLALLYGAGMLENRSSVCGIRRDLEKADQYLAEAVIAGHQSAAVFDDFVRGQSRSERWQQVTNALGKPGQTESPCT